MQKLRCQIARSNDNYVNRYVDRIVTVVEINRACNPEGGFLTKCELDDVPGSQVGEKLIVWSDELIPLDTVMVPPTHSTSRMLKNIWIFVEARNDAWNRDQEPPKDLAAYKDQFGKDWEDNRVFDVKRRQY